MSDGGARLRVMSVQIPGFDYQTVRVNEFAINVATHGEGPALLLLHGFPQTHLAWRGVAPTLSRRFHVVCPDLPGYGASDKSAGHPGAEQYSKRASADKMVALMRQLGCGRRSPVFPECSLFISTCWPSRATCPSG